MFNLDPGKLLVIAVVAIILLGPDRLPQVARQLGGAWRTFNEFRHRMESEVRSTMPDLPPTSEIARLARSPSALLNHLSTLSSDDDEEEPDGSFQPPGAANGNAAPDMNGAAAREVHAGSSGVSVPDAATDVPSEPAPTPAPPHWVPPAPAPPEVIVPGDPTLN